MKNRIMCMLVDDDLDDQEIFLMCLDRVDRSIDCRVCNNGAEALKMLNENPDYVPDFVFLDVNMPKMNGVQCLTSLKQMERFFDTKVFMYSTTSELDIVNETKALGAKEFIVKPASTSDLKKKLIDIFKDAT